MTLDDLLEVFRNHPTTRAGIRAVVEALRDELPRALSEVARQECCGNGVYNGGPQECCGIPNLLVTTDQVHDAINEILASDGVETAGGSARKDGKAVEAVGDKGPVTVNSPAAAPDVCEWVGEGKPPYEVWKRGCTGKLVERAKSPGWCRCGKPIRFVEAK